MAPSKAPATAPAQETSSLLAKEPIKEHLPFFRRLKIGFLLYSFKTFVYIGLRLLRLRNYLTNTNQPTFKTFYSVRPKLEVRVFLPPNHGPTSSPLPTYINIHGGGFALCDPIIDDHFCHALAHKYNHLVLSVAYSLSPQHRFPAALEDIIALVPAILEDASLPIDHARVTLGGFSAGGNLTLAAAQSPSVGPKLKALVPIYPVVDFSGKYKGPARPHPNGTPDMLKNAGSWFNWAYVPPSTLLTNPLLSPVYASRVALPQRAFFVGAQYDLLCHEAHAMAQRLAGPDADGKAEEEDWEVGGVRWRRFHGMMHGFTHQKLKDREEEEKRVNAMEELWGDIAGWLEKIYGEDGR